MTEELKNINDYELLMLYNEEDEFAKDLLYKKYEYLISMIITKNNKYLKISHADYNEIYCECILAFFNALKLYQDEKEASLLTYISLCIERKISNILKKYKTKKYQIEKSCYSLDFVNNNNQEFNSFISDFSKEPLRNITEFEKYTELKEKITRILSDKELDVFNLMTKNLNYSEIAIILNTNSKQVDNTIQRIKYKIKKVINKKA